MVTHLLSKEEATGAGLSLKVAWDICIARLILSQTNETVRGFPPFQVLPPPSPSNPPVSKPTAL